MLKKTKLTLAVLASVFCSTQAVAAWTPDKPVEFVVTAGAGTGAWQVVTAAATNAWPAAATFMVVRPQ